MITRRSTDFLSENKKAVAFASATVGSMRRENTSMEESLRFRAGLTLDTEGLAPPGGTVHLYSSQKLNTGEWARELQRNRLAPQSTSNYTRSAHPAYGVMHINLDKDPRELAKEAADASKSAFITSRGFVYPRGSTREEDLKHAKAAHVSLFLSEPYVEGQDTRAIDAAQARALASEAGKPMFLPHANPAPLGHRGLGYQDPVTGVGSFGFIDLPQTRNSSISPSKVSPQQSSAAFFKSVFLQGKALREEAEAAAAAEAKAAFDGMVVDAPYRFVQHTTKDGTRLERSKSLLAGRPVKHAIKRVVEGEGGGKLPPPLSHPPTCMYSVEEVFPGPSPSLETFLRPLPTPPSGTLGGTATRILKAGFTASGKDFVYPAEPHIITEATLYKPLLNAARQTNAVPGVASLALIPTHFGGVNTDFQATQRG